MAFLRPLLLFAALPAVAGFASPGNDPNLGMLLRSV
jgi:hypothetical protein